jgi:AcrR family transcriptional regulator
VSHAHRQYGGVSADQRRHQRRRLLIEACLNLVGARGASAVTAESVAGEAKLTKRYFYESFADRDAVLVAALDELFVELMIKIRQAITLPVPEIVEVFVSTLCSDPRRARLYTEAAGLPALQARRDVAIVAFAELITSDGSDSGSIETVKRQLMTRIIVAGLTEVVTSWISGALPGTDRATLIEAIVALAATVGPRVDDG